MSVSYLVKIRLKMRNVTFQRETNQENCQYTQNMKDNRVVDVKQIDLVVKRFKK